MSSDASAELRSRRWLKDVKGRMFLVTGQLENLDREWINTALGSEDMYWAKPLPADVLETLMSQSLTLGLYEVLPADLPRPSSPSSPRTPSPTLGSDAPTEQLRQIGMARIITDYITMAYLTDTFIVPEHRGDGLGKWIIACCKDLIMEMPAFRRIILLTNPMKGGPFYRRELGCYDANEDRENTLTMTRGPFEGQKSI